MNDLAHNRVTPTFVVVGITAALATGTANWPDRVKPIFETKHVGASYSSFEKTLTFAQVSDEANFANQLADVYAALAGNQEPLGADFEAVWDANVAILYES
jgi:hypothetical protein